MNNRMSFAVDADSISLKSIYKKEFLELQMRAISTANPNLNGSWFTKEALEDAIETCKNKPILGYFNSDGDFESHNGVWRKDVETGLNYWDTQNGEQILGIIRENDDIKIVEGDDGLYWLCLSCALWTQYNFKQVKRLVKDAKRAKENNGVTKNISVEIDIIEGEKQEDGVYRIDKFKLAGITILGSRKGKQVLPGIADAALSIPEIAGSDFYEQQQTAIRAAYARLDNTDGGNNKEDVLTMADQETIEPKNILNPAENLEGNKTFSTEEGTTAAEVNTNKDFAAGEGEGEVCPVCGQNPCICQNDCGSEGEGAGEDDKEKNCGSFEDDDNSDDNEGNNNDGAEDGKENNCGSYETDGATVNEIRDVAWLIKNMSYSFDEINCSLNYYKYLVDNEPEQAPHATYIISVLTRILNAETKIQGTLGGLLNKIAGEISEADTQYEAKLAQYENVDELISNYEAEVSKNQELTTNYNSLNASNEELKAKLSKYAHEEFLAEADNLIKSVKLDEEVAKQIYEACEKGELQSYDEVKTKVAFAVLEAQQKIDNTSNNNASLQTPVETPDVQAAFEAKAENSQKLNSWDKMRAYTRSRRGE